MLLSTLVGPTQATAALTSPTQQMAGSTNPAHITAEKITGRVDELTISTPAFSKPTMVDVDLPTDYAADPSRRWPVTYILAGTMNTYTSFNSVVGGVALTKDFPSIVVSPNGDSGYWSDWYNSGAGGPPEYETYVIDQLIPLIDAHFRTIATRAQRAIMGISMGGYGSAMLAAEHPDLFADAATLSGAVDSNLPTLAAALAVSPEFQGGAANAIYGPQATQEVRWHGHNPTDIANNLRSLNLQVRTANGIPDPSIGEDPASADTASCIIEGGVHMGTVDFHNALVALNIPHLYKDYGPGCHTTPNFKRELTDTINVFTQQFAHPPATPTTFDYESIQPTFTVYGWQVSSDPKRALEFLQLTGVHNSGLTLTGSGLTTVTTPALFRGVRQVDLTGATQKSTTPDSTGRIAFTVDLGAADTDQQYTPLATTTRTRRIVSFAAYAQSTTPVAGTTPATTTAPPRNAGSHQDLAFTGLSTLVPLVTLALLGSGGCAVLARRRRRDEN